MSRDFKVGDRVRILNGDAAGETGTVSHVSEDGGYVFLKDIPKWAHTTSAPGPWHFSTRSVELVEEPQFRKGDRVRVTFEAEYEGPGPLEGAHQLAGGAVYIGKNGVDNLDIVKLADPFQPGDVVREKSSDRLFVLGKDGYFQWTPTVGRFVEYEDGGAVSGIEGSFPSNDPDYVKVEVPLD